MHVLLYLGLEEDFKAWKDGFVKRVFPVLVGEVAMSQLTSGSSCECGGKRKKECCKEKTKLNSEQIITVAERDIAAAAQAALGPPESRHWPPKGRPSAAAGRRGSAAPAKNLKSLFSSQMVNWTMSTSWFYSGIQLSACLSENN